jgi:hypothetical protein
VADVSAENRIGIWAETGGDLTRDRTLFRFGKRVESLHLNNGTGTARLFDVQVARDPVFYWPASPSGGHANRREIRQETYFYVIVPANSPYSSPPFFAPRGLKVKSQGSGNCTAHAIVYGVTEGEITTKDIG